MERPLILASSSIYRAKVLSDAGWSFEVESPDVDEVEVQARFPGLSEEPLALELARLKARSVASLHPSVFVVAADQVGIVGDGPERSLLTKRVDCSGAVAQLRTMSGTTHRLVNGIVIMDSSSGRIVEGLDVQTVTMRSFTDAEALDYVTRFEPFDTAGSYRIEDGPNMAPLPGFVTNIVGEHASGVLGMPLPLFERLASQIGLPQIPSGV